jgi:hypothetical protein
MAKKQIKVEEVDDGSAVVEIPKSMQPIETDENSDDAGAGVQAQANEGGDSNLDDHPDDTEAIREAKRQKRRARKEYHKQVQQEKDTRLQMLQRQNQELLERLSVVERRTHGSELARVENQMKEQEAKILFAKNKIKEAAETGNGDLLLNAQDMLYEARRDYESLENVKRAATQPRQQQQTIKAPDPLVQSLAAKWMQKNAWYNANGNDMDSQVTQRIDQLMADEGWNPSSQDYWEELDNRLQRYLPHRYNDSNDDDVRKPKKHKSVVTSTGRESLSGGKNTFVLTPDQVKAMKDAGFWDDPEKRQKMIKRYAQEARLQRG